MNHTTKGFWKCYYKLPEDIQELADKNFELLKKNKRYPSLCLKKIEDVYSVRIGSDYRALGIKKNGNIYWFWTGDHDEYMRILKKS